MIQNINRLLAQIRSIHEAIRDSVLASCERQSIEQLSAIVGEQAGDTIFALDRVSEEVLLEHFTTLGNERSFVLIAEGLGESGMHTFPEGADPTEVELRIIIDPIDGTRGIVYQKRAAWILTGVAPNRGPQTGIKDIELAVQTEIPLVKQYLCDSFWAVIGRGTAGERINLLTDERLPLKPHPSHAITIAQGYGQISRFFPGGRTELAAIDDAIVERVLGHVQPGETQTYEDQYISTGGQFYELLMGHDRWIGDLRALIDARESKFDRALGLNCHPYDVCTALIGNEAGLIITDPSGEPLNSPLDVTSGVAWIGYANRAIHDQLAPVVQAILREHGLLEEWGL